MATTSISPLQLLIAPLSASALAALFWLRRSQGRRQRTCSPHDHTFRRLFEAGDVSGLQSLDMAVSHLQSRLVVASASELAAQLTPKGLQGTALNSQQVVFVTPASSWVEWLSEVESAQPRRGGDREKAQSSLDFVGWDREGIQWARREGFHARIYVWVDRDTHPGEAEATWDFISIRFFRPARERRQMERSSSLLVPQNRKGGGVITVLTTPGL